MIRILGLVWVAGFFWLGWLLGILAHKPTMKFRITKIGPDTYIIENRNKIGWWSEVNVSEHYSFWIWKEVTTDIKYERFRTPGEAKACLEEMIDWIRKNDRDVYNKKEVLKTYDVN